MPLRTFSIQTLGCKVNQYEAEQLAAALRSRGLAPAAAGQPADVRVVHTCSVTVQAAGKSRQAARRAGANDADATPPSPQTIRSLPVLTARPFSDATGGSEFSGEPSPLFIERRSETTGDAKSAGGDASSPAARPRVLVTGCWATSDPDAAAAVPGVDAVLTHHDDVAAGLDRLLHLWRDEGQTAGRIGEERGSAASPENTGNTGRPPGDSAEVIQAAPARGVNGKIGPASTPEPLIGNPAPTSAARPGTTGLPLLGDRQTGRQRALLKVQDGCDAHCTYCIIPKLRSTVWSKPIEAAVDEARRLVDAGHVELVLTGIFLGAYGHETALRRRQKSREGERGRVGEGETDAGRSRGEAWAIADLKSQISNPDFSPSPTPPLAPSPTLPLLIRALCARVPGLRRVRLSSLEPGDLTDDLVAALRSHPQVVPHFHLPLQSGSDALLRRMNRQYGRDDFLRMLDRVRSAFDRPALTTDVIVGFPGESDAEFERTAEVVEAAGIIHVHAFGFSPRPGTAAARWQKDFVRGPVVNKRIARLRAIADRHSLMFRQQFIGETVELLVEREREDDGGPAHGSVRHGRSERYFPVWFEDPTAQPGDFARVRVTEATPTRTHGTRVG